MYPYLKEPRPVRGEEGGRRAPGNRERTVFGSGGQGFESLPARHKINDLAALPFCPDGFFAPFLLRAYMAPVRRRKQNILMAASECVSVVRDAPLRGTLTTRIRARERLSIRPPSCQW